MNEITLETVKIEISKETKGEDRLLYAISIQDVVQAKTSGKYIDGEDVNQVHSFENSAEWIKADYVLYLGHNEHEAIVNYLRSIDIKGTVTVLQEDDQGEKKTLVITL